MVFCPDCGKDVPEAKFCKNCGAYIANIKEIEPEEETDNVALIESNELNDAAPVSKSFNNVNYCYNCGNPISGEFKFCPECGQNLSGDIVKSSVKSPDAKKNIIIAVILSIFLPGLGQIYLGLDHKGSMFLIAYVVSAILILILIGFLLCTVIWIWALADTVMSTNALNRGEEVRDKIL